MVDEDLPGDGEPPSDEGPDPGDAPPEFDLGALRFDAPFAVKDAYFRVTTTSAAIEAPGSTINVSLPGQAATNAVGPRAPRLAKDVAGSAEAGARHNWIPTGPRNVGGAVRSLAIHPSNPSIMYAGPATGGVHKSVDGGESWFALWHDEPSLAIGAISICHDHPNVVWAATGEIRPNSLTILGNGVYRSEDDGLQWKNALVPPAQPPGILPLPPVPGMTRHGARATSGFAFDAIAAHPTNERSAWAVGKVGVFRTMDGGVTWDQFETGTYYSDIVFSRNATGPIVYAVRAGTVVRIDHPDAAATGAGSVAAAFASAANHSVVPGVPGVPPTGVPGPFRGKLAICERKPDTAYIRLASLPNDRGHNLHLGVWRTHTARDTPASTIAWTRLADHPDWPREGQGDYNLSIGVSPRDENAVATGMVELYVARNADAPNPADVRWRRAMAWELYQLDRAHHADNHQAIFAPVPGEPDTTELALWVANDGGISRSTDWRTGNGYARTTLLPLPRGVMTWRKRSHGISAAQMYDLTQSPLVPSMFACGLQDNGVYVTLGGQSWRVVLGGDGGFVAFDPDDPYRFLAADQLEIAEVVFPGRMLGRYPSPGDAIEQGLWPRTLTQGFLPGDHAAFAAETVHHPRRAGRVLHAREHRLYGRRREQGDRFTPEDVGRGLELIYPSGAATATLLIAPSAGARRLGLAAQVNRHSRDEVDPAHTVRSPAAAVARARSALPGPYALQAGDQLQLSLDGTALPPITFVAGREIADLARASVAEVAAFIRRALKGFAGTSAGAALVDARAVFWPRPDSVEITTTAVGAEAKITLGGTAVAALGCSARAYDGDASRPASVTLFVSGSNLEPGALPDAPPLKLTVKIGAAVGSVTFSSPPFTNLQALPASKLAESLRAALGSDPATVTAVTSRKRLRFIAVFGTIVTLTGTALPQLGFSASPSGESVVASPPTPASPQAPSTHWFDLRPSPNPLELIITRGTVDMPLLAPLPPLVFSAADVSTLERVTVEELQRMVSTHLAAHPGVLAEVEIVSSMGTASEIAHAPSDPDVTWVGGTDGVLFRRKTDDAPWETISAPQMQIHDRTVEAIAIDPRDPEHVLVGLVGPKIDYTGMLWRTLDGGRRWENVGAALKDARGVPTGVNALEIDPDEPDRVYAGMDVGVFRSTDAGEHWQPFNEGLPNTVVTDLAFVPATRTLRAGAWGRGTFERHVGERPPQDVRLYVRASELDVGVRPAPRGPAGFDATPRAQPRSESPDIKVARDRPPWIGLDARVDGVEFDEDIHNEEPTPGPAHVFVQVHNRGAFAATKVRKVLLWADAANGPPALAEDFWSRFAAAPTTPLPAVIGDWKVLGDSTLIDPGAAGRIDPGYPRVHTFDVEWPTGSTGLDAHRRIGILLLVSCKEDVLGSGERDVAALLANERRVAYRETATVRSIDDRRLLLRATGATRFTIAAPAAGVAPGPPPPPATNLGFGALPLPADLLHAGGSEPFDLSAGAPQALDFSTPPAAVTITFREGPADVVDLARATALEVVTIINRALFAAGIPVQASLLALNTPTQRFRLTSSGDTLFGVTGTAAKVLGLAEEGTTSQVDGLAPSPYKLDADGPHTLTISASGSTRIELPMGEDDIPVLAAAQARDVRRVLNRGFQAANLPIRAVIPRVDLRVRQSSTDIDGRPVAPAGRHLADLVAEPTTVADGARAALFDIVRVQALDPIRPSVQNFLYLRCTNRGTMDQVDVRHRLWLLNLSVTPVTATALPGPAVATVPAAGSRIVELRWTPGALTAGAHVFVLAVCDHATDYPTNPALDGDVTFATIAELDAFCARNPNATYREFVVA